MGAATGVKVRWGGPRAADSPPVMLRRALHRVSAAVLCAALAAAAPPAGIYFMRTPGVAWNQAYPSTLTPELLWNVTRTIDGVPNPDLQVRCQPLATAPTVLHYLRTSPCAPMLRHAAQRAAPACCAGRVHVRVRRAGELS